MTKITGVEDANVGNGVEAPWLQAGEYFTCVSLSKTPLESLVLIHEFLRNLDSIKRHEGKGEQVAQPDPFIRRET